MADRHAEADALIYLGTRFRYGWLKDAVERFATALARLGVIQGDRVLLYLGNCPQWIIANFAIQRIGAVVVPVSPIYTAHELAYMVEDARVETVICLDTNFGYVQEVFSAGRLRQVIVTTWTEVLPAWKRAAGALLNRVPSGQLAKAPHIHRFGALLRSHPPAPPQVEIDPLRDLASILYTGGTTAFPKGVPGNHATELAYVRDVMEDVVGGVLAEGGDRLLMPAPLFHIMPKGFFIAVGLNMGNTTVLLPRPQIDALLSELQRWRVGWMLGVPAMYRMILENERLDQYRLDSLRYCFCGGDVLPTEVFERWRRRAGAPIYQVYGSTEVGHLAYSPLDTEPDPRVIGQILKSYRVRVADPETHEEVEQGEVGELWVTADFTLKGYLNQPEESARAFVQHGGETWYRMGDFVAQDPDGAIRFHERTTDIIKYKGYRVSASEVEATLQDHPAVVGACVVGIPDAEVGERIKAIVVLQEEAKGVSGTDLRSFCRGRLAPYKVPRYVEFRDMLPKSKVGKLLRREIRDEERRKN
jgi:long-chain acyl-CoA synthetase